MSYKRGQVFLFDVQEPLLLGIDHDIHADIIAEAEATCPRHPYLARKPMRPDMVFQGVEKLFATDVRAAGLAWLALVRADKDVLARREDRELVHTNLEERGAYNAF